MTPIQSREEVASSIASGIASAAGSITSADTVTLDGSSEYPGNSTAAEKIPEEANYAASKAGVIGLTKTAAKELASRGICRIDSWGCSRICSHG